MAATADNKHDRPRLGHRSEGNESSLWELIGSPGKKTKGGCHKMLEVRPSADEQERQDHVSPAARSKNSY